MINILENIILFILPRNNKDKINWESIVLKLPVLSPYTGPEASGNSKLIVVNDLNKAMEYVTGKEGGIFDECNNKKSSVCIEPNKEKLSVSANSGSSLIIENKNDHVNVEIFMSCGQQTNRIYKTDENEWTIWYFLWLE